MTATAAPAEVEAFAERLFAAALGAVELTVVHLGRALGLYAALRGCPAVTPAELAARAGVDARYAREWACLMVCVRE